MKKSFLLSVGLFVILVVAAIQIFLLTKTPPLSVVYIDNIRLFNEFNMTKEVGAAQQQQIKFRAVKRDSLIAIAEPLSDRTTPAFQNLVKQINTLDQEIGALEQDLNTTRSQQIWDRLNTHIKEFSENNNYDLVVGTQGNGTVMYGNESLNVTEEVLTFVNLKYEGN